MRSAFCFSKWIDPRYWKSAESVFFECSEALAICSTVLSMARIGVET
jgi:hypothetical protein